ncbi:MAG: hypothetical protein EB084_20375 [Proteobacteria bacterium]|nr:hypothetical protein [Pseudomonadota bacterium]
MRDTRRQTALAQSWRGWSAFLQAEGAPHQGAMDSRHILPLATLASSSRPFHCVRVGATLVGLLSTIGETPLLVTLPR